MPEKCVLSIDIGTTGLKFGIYNAEGRCLYFSRKDTPLKECYSGTVGMEAIYDAVLEGTYDVVKQSGMGGCIEVVGIDGQMGGICGIDEQWRPVIEFDPPINNNFKPYMRDSLREHGDVIVQETGSIPINGAKIVYWMKEHPALFTKVRKVLSLSGYIIAKLIGTPWEEAFIDRTTLYLFGLAKGGRWSERVCELLGIPKCILPEIKESSQIVGSIGSDASRASGLREGTPLIAGTGDTASSILGAGVVSEGDAVDIAGTCSVFGICTAKDVVDREHKALLRMEAPIPDTYYLVGIGFGGEVYRWFLRNVCRCTDGDTVHKELTRGAQRLQPGSDNLLFFPFLGGTFTPPNERVRGTWIGLDWNHTVHHMYRSVLESFAYEYYYYRGIYSNLSHSGHCGSVRVTGSGKKNHLWNRIKSDVLGVDYVLLKRDDHENFGTALVALYAAGLMSNLHTDLEKYFEIDKRFGVNEKNRQKYKPFADMYVSCKTECMEDIYRRFTELLGG